jgi:hypothetical protein
MEWANDEYKELKYKIYDLLVMELAVQDAKMLSVKHLGDSIDELFEKLVIRDES